MKQKGILIFSAIIIAMFCVLGIFCKPMPYDEYAFYNTVAHNGFIQSQISLYLGWSGRVLNTFLVYLCASFKLEKVQPFLPFITVITYILAVFSLIGTLIPSLKTREKLSLSFLVCALTLCFLFALGDTFYWMPGLPYFWSTTLIVFALSLAVKAFRGSTSSFWMCMIVLFLNGTVLEQPCIYQGVAAFLAMLFFFWKGDRKRALMSGAFWLAAIAGFCVMYFAPGTAKRIVAENHAELAPLITRILRAFIVAGSAGVLNTFQFFAKPMLYSVIFFMPVIADKIPPADEKLSRKLRVWHIVVAMLAISMFMQYMMGVIIGGGMPDRAISHSMWLMAFTWTMFWVFMYRGEALNSEGFRKICARLRWPVLIISVLVSANFRECVSALRIAPEFAAEWEARVESMVSQREKGIMHLQVPPLKTKPKLIFAEIPTYVAWPGRAFAQYYGAENVVLVPEELSTNSEDVQKLLSGDLSPYAKLAENGDIDAIKIIATYRNPRAPGSREAKDIDEAFKWYMMGAEAGDPECMKSLPRLLLNKNFFLAVGWQLKAYALLTRL